MDEIEVFLAHAVFLEREAARRYEELSAAMGTDGNADLKAFFRQMAHYSRMHLAEAQARSGFRTVPDIAPEDFQWPDGTAPETAGWAGVDALMSVHDALQLALEGERRGHAYYGAILATTADPEVRRMAAEFAAEEAEHVHELERRLVNLPA